MKLALQFILLSALAHAAAPLPIETTLADAQAISGATFQSHNQKVVRNARCIFMTHVRSRNEKYTARQWRLSRSKDGGKSLETLHESTDATNPPARTISTSAIPIG